VFSNIHYNATHPNITNLLRQTASLSYNPILLMSMRNFTLPPKLTSLFVLADSLIFIAHCPSYLF
jgi:hypothetical protein